MSASYKYDPLGRRIEKNINETITKYLYDKEDIIAAYDGNNQLVAHYIHGPGIDEPIAMVRNSQSYFYHLDGLGSVTGITDTNGTAVQRYDYDSFGNIVSMLDPNFKQPYTYTSRGYDEETGLYFYRARYYDSTSGRFITEDPIRFAGGDVNFYAYVENNPVKFVDPFGLYIINIPSRETYGNMFPSWAPKLLVDFLYDMYKEPDIGPVCMARKSDIKLIDRIVKKLKLSKTQIRMLHDEITGQNLTPKEIEEIADYIRRNFPNK
jgi:RHS repeat-associated protein